MRTLHSLLQQIAHRITGDEQGPFLLVPSTFQRGTSILQERHILFLASLQRTPWRKPTVGVLERCCARVLCAWVETNELVRLLGLQPLFIFLSQPRSWLSLCRLSSLRIEAFVRSLRTNSIFVLRQTASLISYLRCWCLRFQASQAQG